MDIFHIIGIKIFEFCFPFWRHYKVRALTISPHLPRELGTRHRAAIGITEDTDAIAIVVSEETGTVSYIENGHILSNMEGDTLRAKLKQALGPLRDRQEPELESKPREGTAV